MVLGRRVESGAATGAIYGSGGYPGLTLLARRLKDLEFFFRCDVSALPRFAAQVQGRYLRPDRFL